MTLVLCRRVHVQIEHPLEPGDSAGAPPFPVVCGLTTKIMSACTLRGRTVASWSTAWYKLLSTCMPMPSQDPIPPRRRRTLFHLCPLAGGLGRLTAAWPRALPSRPGVCFVDMVLALAEPAAVVLAAARELRARQHDVLVTAPARTPQEPRPCQDKAKQGNMETVSI